MTEKKKTGFALLSPEQRKAMGRRAYEVAKAKGRVGHRWTADEARALGMTGATTCREQGKRHAFTAADTAKSTGRFDSDRARLASERKHDLAARRDPNVEWVDETR